MIDRQRVLVFGASGFLGRAVATALDGDPRVGALIRGGVRIRGGSGGAWVHHDLISGSTQQLSELLRAVQPDVVVNCVGKLAGDAEVLAGGNVLVTARLIEAVSKIAPGTRLVTMGSAAEYGPVEAGRPVAEDQPVDPVAMYGVTKSAATQLVRLAAAAGALDAVVLRVFNPLGAGIPAENVMGRAAVQLRAALDRGDDRILLGPLSAYRDFVDMRDVASAVREAALGDPIEDTVLNVGSGRAVLVRDAVHRLAEIAGFTGRIEETAAAPARSGSVDWIAADLTRVRAALGWEPTHDLDASLTDIWTGRSSDPVVLHDVTQLSA